MSEYEFISAYDLMQSLVACDIDMCKENVKVAYMNDDIRKNLAIFVQDTVALGNTLSFIINVRGYPNKGKTTAYIMKSLLKYNKKTMVYEIGGEEVGIQYVFNTVQGEGVDDLNRVVMSAQITCNIKQL